MKLSTKQIVTTGVLLAICIISQFFKNLSVYITGPIINACLVICLLSCGLACALILSVITPVTAFFITGSPIISAIPMIMPFIMIGNALLVIWIYCLNGRIAKGSSSSLPISMAIGCIIKALAMGTSISLWIIPTFLPGTAMAEKLMPKMSIFQQTFSFVQLITAIVGCVYAYVIWIPLKKSFVNN